jgi:hypothetical protein
MAKDGYLGPRVEARRQREATLKRIEQFVARRTGEIHRDNVARWAGEDDTAFPTLVAAREQARFEAETLFRALGSWAGVPDGVIPFRERQFDDVLRWLGGA